MTTDCSQNFDSLRLVREGTSQEQRKNAALDPTYAPANGRTIADAIVFARRYGRLLKYYDVDNQVDGDWEAFFAKDVSALLSLVAVEDLDVYKDNIKTWFDYLLERSNAADVFGLKLRLGFLYDSIGSVAQQAESLRATLPDELPLKGALKNTIVNQLAPALKRLIGYYKGGVVRGLIVPGGAAPSALILQSPVVKFQSVFNSGFSSDTETKLWSDGGSWATFTAAIAADASVYGDALGTPFTQINHCAAHNLFKSVFDTFLKAFARLIQDAGTALEQTLTEWDRHEPHYALFLSFLKLFEHAREASNAITARHLDFYYRTVLQLKEKAAEPSQVHLVVELAKQALSHEFKQGELFKAGKDALGKDAFFAADRDFVANRAKVVALEKIYRHGDEAVAGSTADMDRLFAAPVANSDDGLGATLTSADGSWQPFFNKVFVDGELNEIKMPTADIGFAIASHYLLLEGGTRTVTVDIVASSLDSTLETNHDDRVVCQFTSTEGWTTVAATTLASGGGLPENTLRLQLTLSGTDAAVTPYDAAVHGYNFDTELPVLLVLLKQDDNTYFYPEIESILVESVALEVAVTGLKTLALSNDFGPIDASKPFQPFGASPIQGSSLIVGSKELFQKTLTSASLQWTWMSAPDPYNTTPTVAIDYLKDAQWQSSGGAATSISAETYSFAGDLSASVIDAPEFTANESYSSGARTGFARLKLSASFGQVNFQTDLLKYVRKDSGATDPGAPPVGPMASEPSLDYTAATELDLDSSATASFEERSVQFLHVLPFGSAERHPALNSGKPVSLVPQFTVEDSGSTSASEGEIYIGISGLEPPQTLSLLFAVSDGTANPLVDKPDPPESHLHFSYLVDNVWADFTVDEVQDSTSGLLKSGIVTLSVPKEASSDNTALPSGMHWIRVAVSEKSDAVCSLLQVATQSLQATFVDSGNDPAFTATPLPAGTISKLDQPDAAVKTITQPFTSFGGSGAEESADYYVRVSERLRHKDRGITLWDYEHLILSAFPQVFKVKCLNHTQYEPSGSGSGIYRELAPGHVTIVTIPDLRAQSQLDPLKPYTSLGVLEDIESFLAERASCFVTLHVRNPQFEEVRITTNVHLRDGYDDTYYTSLLQTSITQFLSPWAFADVGSPSFGGKIYKSKLIDFIEDQPYVDYVTDLRLFLDIGGAAGTEDLDVAEASTAVSVLVSASAAKHAITLLKPNATTSSTEACECDA